MKENLSEEFYEQLYTTCANAIHNVAKKVIPDELQLYSTSSTETVYSYSDLDQKKCLAKEALTLLSAVCNMKVCNKLELSILNDIYDKTMVMSSQEENNKLAEKYEYLIINTCELLSKLLKEEALSEDQESSCKLSTSTEQKSTDKKYGVFSSFRPFEFREYPSIESFLYNDENKLRKGSLELKRGLKDVPSSYHYTDSSNTSEFQYNDWDHSEISGPDVHFNQDTENLSIHYFEVPSSSIPNMDLKPPFTGSRQEVATYAKYPTYAYESSRTSEVGNSGLKRSKKTWQEAHNQELADLVKCLVQTVAYMKGKSNIKPFLPEREPLVLPYPPSAYTAYSERTVEFVDHATSPLVESPAESEKEYTLVNPNRPNVILRNSASQTVEPGEPIVAPKIFTFFLREGDPTFHKKLPMGPPSPKPRCIKRKCSTADARSSRHRSKVDVYSRKSLATVNTIPSHENIELSKAFYGFGLDLTSHNSDDSVEDGTETESDFFDDLSYQAEQNRTSYLKKSKKIIRCKVDSGIRLKAMYKKHNQVLSTSIQKDAITDTSEEEVISTVEETIEPSEPTTTVKTTLRPERDEWEKLMAILQSTAAQKPRAKPVLKVEKNDARKPFVFPSRPSLTSKQRSKPDKQEKQLINAADKLLSKIINEDLLKIYEERRIREIESELGTDDDDDDHPPILP
ncbi:uncharacterized protein LOC106666933 [Cimex lectularius]|uniref:Uncharacterized protein n=1 Tax=Cimex lectularius TaxID=79782 RepID=A0A8I6RQZ0_CIMLE|nr:uncharacterized protein LOC106666933 [Cimex lectularius]